MSHYDEPILDVPLFRLRYDKLNKQYVYVCLAIDIYWTQCLIGFSWRWGLWNFTAYLGPLMIGLSETPASWLHMERS